MESKISYKSHKDFLGWKENAEGFMRTFIKNRRIERILEIGAGANPTIDSNFVRTEGIEYTINDIDSDELDKAEVIFSRDTTDFCADGFQVKKQFDLIFSRMTGEHFYNAKNLHENVFKSLEDGGYSVHFFATIGGLPFLANKVLPDRISESLLNIFNPRDSYKNGKFKAYYDKSYGPTKKMLQFFTDMGYEVEEYIGYFGHNYYRRIPLIRDLENLKSRFLLQYPLPYLTTYATVILRKP